MGRWVFTVCWALLVVGCGDTDFYARAGDEVVGGTADRGRTPAVVAIGINSGTALCSGTLIASRWVLTARHCVSETNERVDCEHGGGRVYADRDPRGLWIIAGDSARTGTIVAQGDALRVPDVPSLCGNDIALIHLDRPVNDIAPMALGTARMERGGEIRVVGFGRRGDTARSGIGVRYRRDAVGVVESAVREFAVTEGPCSGDSGSPAIDPVRNTVVGVLSRGSENCRGDDALGIYTQTAVFSGWIRDTVRGTR